jgi:hypothetical protein
MNGGKMKTLYFVCICLSLICTASPAIADWGGLQISSEKYTVSGGIYFSSGDPYKYNWETTSSSGVSDSISWNSAEAGASAGSIARQLYVSSGASIFNSGYNYPNYFIDGTYSYASASVTFEAVSYDGWLNVEGIISGYTGYGSVNLTDNTTGTEIFHTFDVQYSGKWLVYDSHEYTLYLYYNASAWRQPSDFMGGSANAYLSFTPIPEPASVLLIGAGFFFARFRRTQ